MVKEVFAFRNTRDIAAESSSGGAFSAVCEAFWKIAEETERGAVIYGAGFDEDLNLVHQRTGERTGYEQFRGSKYVRSRMSGICQKIQEDLEAGRLVLFSGTPCQVYAVKQYCRKKELDAAGLYLVDIICHGTASPDVWKKFKAWMEKKYGSVMTGFDFRYKKSKWSNYPVKAVFADGKELVNTIDARMFTTLFFTALPLNGACYRCHFAGTEREGDLTLGDFWGIERVMPEFPKGNGTSEILVSTEKGKCLMGIVKQICENALMQSCDSDEYVKYQHNLNAPTREPKNRKQFQKDLMEQEFETVLRRYAGYTLPGKILHVLNRWCAENGIKTFVKRIIGRKY